MMDCGAFVKLRVLTELINEIIYGVCRPSELFHHLRFALDLLQDYKSGCIGILLAFAFCVRCDNGTHS